MLTPCPAEKCDYVPCSLIHRELAQILAARTGWGEQHLQGANPSLERCQASRLTSAREDNVDLFSPILVGDMSAHRLWRHDVILREHDDERFTRRTARSGIRCGAGNLSVTIRPRSDFLGVVIVKSDLG